MAQPEERRKGAEVAISTLTNLAQGAEPVVALQAAQTLLRIAGYPNV